MVLAAAPHPLFSPTRRRLLLLVVGALAPLALLFRLGHIVSRHDPIEHADAIYVLAGSRAGRAIEAAHLYREGHAPRIVLSPGDMEPAEKALIAQGIPIQNDAERARDLLVNSLHLPADAILIVPRLVDNTAQEVDAIKPMVDSGGWRSLIVVGDRPNGRRIGYAFHRVLGARVKIIVTASRDDRYNPDRWWATRGTFRATFYEAPKLLAYWLGLAG